MIMKIKRTSITEDNGKLCLSICKIKNAVIALLQEKILRKENVGD